MSGVWRVSLGAVDLVLLLALLLFGVWGALKGSLRQVASLVVLAVAFPVATRFGPRLESSVVKAVSASQADVRLLAWTVVFAATLVAGGVVIALLQPLFPRPRHGERGLGFLLGLLHGLLVLTVLVHAALLAFPRPDRPAVVRALEASHARVAARAIRGWVDPALVVPPWMRARLREVDAPHRIDASGRVQPPREGTGASWAARAGSTSSSSCWSSAPAPR